MTDTNMNANTNANSNEEEDEYPPLSYLEAKAMAINKLREELKKRGLNASGTKKKSVNRIKYYATRGMLPHLCNAFSFCSDLSNAD